MNKLPSIEKRVEEAYKALVLAKNNELNIADEMAQKDELHSTCTRQMIVTAMSYLDDIQIGFTQDRANAIEAVIEAAIKIVMDHHYELEEWYSSAERPQTLSYIDANQKNIQTRNKITAALEQLDTLEGKSQCICISNGHEKCKGLCLTC